VSHVSKWTSPEPSPQRDGIPLLLGEKGSGVEVILKTKVTNLIE